MIFSLFSNFFQENAHEHVVSDLISFYRVSNKCFITQTHKYFRQIISMPNLIRLAKKQYNISLF